MVEYPSQKKLEARIESYEERHQEGLQLIHELLDDKNENASNLASVYSSQTPECMNIAASHLLLDNLRDAQEWYAEDANYKLRLEEVRREYPDDVDRETHESAPTNLKHGIFAAALSGDRRLTHELAEATLSIEPSYLEDFTGGLPEQWYHRSKLIARIVLDDKDHEKHFRALRMESLNDASEGIRDVSRGILDDVAKTKEGISTLVDLHTDEVLRGEDPSGSTECVAFTAAGALVIARAKGLDVTLDSPYLPELLYDIELDLRQPDPNRSRDE